jgi:UDP-N-acetylglucosamine--N-acetylmuramyl-(pentapeptide) pyrophosphoryl-undecaprenol N-acetylglucosamine transferase
MTKTIILSSGGTGGHVFPALSLAEELSGRGYQVTIMTDHRGEVFQKATGVSKVIALPTWQSKGPLGYIVLAFGLALSFFIALAHMVRSRPSVVVGFGGYPSIPAVIAAKILRVPTALHEQNAILGRANRLLARFVHRIGISFEKVKFIDSYWGKVIYTGNPVRKKIIAVREEPYQVAGSEEKFRIFVIGGSQGARVFSSVVPQALCRLPKELRKRLKVYQQCRPELLESTRKAYEKSEIKVDVRPFFDDVDQQLQQAQLIIARSGASTVAELMTSGRPAIFVPYPYAMDDHQQANASNLSDRHAAWVILEKDFTPQKLQQLLENAINDENTLKIMAKNMRKFGQPTAAIKLAQMVEKLLPNL